MIKACIVLFAEGESKCIESAGLPDDQGDRFTYRKVVGARADVVTERVIREREYCCLQHLQLFEMIPACLQQDKFKMYMFFTLIKY